MPIDDNHPESSEPTEEHRPLPAGVPRTIGHYKIQSVIASGGMGTVYKAVQEKPRRAVAVKVMKAGLASGSALRRFEYESQLLGRLRHPGIAQIFEAGTHNDGTGDLPYFAMEYIPNARSITDYVKTKQLSICQRVELFAQVCDAVHHGHQKGIVHRDLKPGNILVGPNGNARVIDFGVARSTDSDMALTGMQTDVGQLIGTVQYMSPEQCDADPHDVDTRSDVYALGVVLYEILCGALPYRLADTPIYEATRLIRETNPGRPSLMDPALRGDLETIVLKTLEKDRDRRYQSTAELALDLRRYLAGDAIMARPASVGYQLRIFARRNKGLLVAMVIVVLALVAGAVVSTALYFRGETSRLQAVQQQQKAQAAEDYLQDIVSAVDPMKYGEQVRVSVLLDLFGEQIEERFADQPEVEATVRMALAGKYMYLNVMQRSESSDDYWLAAETHMTRAFELRHEALGEGHPETVKTLELMAFGFGFSRFHDKSEKIRRDLLELRDRTQGPEHLDTLNAGNKLASVLCTREKYEEAESMIRWVVDELTKQLGAEDPSTLNALDTLVLALKGQRKLEEAEALSQRVLEAQRRIAEPKSKPLFKAVAAMADAFVARGEFAQAGELFNSPFDAAGLRVKHWYREESTPAEVGWNVPTLVIFWEPWCPYCYQFAPRMQGLYEAYGKQVQFVGLTSLSHDDTEEQALNFIDSNGLTFRNGLYDGEAFTDFGFMGYPGAMAIKNGQIVWKGHPARITPSFLEGLVGQPG
jgi:thiol-disulfide isomerase/thioredoxin/serine/threonine-protein kinase RIO1